MRAVILAGGRGARLRPFTVVIPKPLVPIDETPILEILVRQLKAQGFDRITLCVGYLSALIQAYCGDGSAWDVELDYVREAEPLGTAGCLGQLDDLTEDRILVVNGDTFTDLDMAEAYREHDPADAATVCANRRSVPTEFGVLEADGDGRLKAYVEKPEMTYDVSMGVNVLSAWAIDTFVEAGKALDMPDLLRRIMNAGGTVRVHRSDAYWLDLGRMSDLELAADAFAVDPSRFLP
jgi:NDP-sugar pyrophosphorylase family protein